MIYKLRRLLSFRHWRGRLSVKPLLRIAVIGDHVQIDYLGRPGLPQHAIIELYHAAGYWGLEPVQPGPWERTSREMRAWTRVIRLMRKDTETSARLEQWPKYKFTLPIIYRRTEQQFPAAYDLLVDKIGSGLELTLPEFDQLTRDAVVGSLPPEEAMRRASAIR